LYDFCTTFLGEKTLIRTRAVSLLWMCKTATGWKRYPAAMGRNGKIRPHHAQVGEEQIDFPVGHYELRSYQGRKTVFKNVGRDASLAYAELLHEKKNLALKDAAADVGVKIDDAPGRVNLELKAKDYIKRQVKRGKTRAAETFKIAFDEFLPAVGVVYADQLQETHILDWYDFLRKKPNSARTIYNKHVSVFGFLNWCNVATALLAKKAPSFTEPEVEIYTPEELDSFFKSLTKPYHSIVFDVLLKTGLRMQEAMFLEWHNFDFSRGTLTVREKDDLGFDIKDKAERTLPIPVELIHHLKTWRKEHKGRLVLGTSNDTPNWKWLTMLKRSVRRAGLNCDQCRPCREREECERWYLHKFRATYTTNLLRAGIDVRTVMLYTGHEDMATVLRYLSAAEGKDTQDKINTIVWTKSS
jgi:integrase